MVADTIVADCNGVGRNWATVANLAVAVVCVPVAMLDRVDGAVVFFRVDAVGGRHAVGDGHVLVRAALWAVDSLENSVLVVGNHRHVVSIIIFVLEDAVGCMVSGNVGGVSVGWVAALLVLVAAVGVLVWGHIFAVVGAAITSRVVMVVVILLSSSVGEWHVLIGARLWAIDGLEHGMLVVGDHGHVMSIVVFVLEDAMSGVISGNVGSMSVGWVAALVVLVTAMSVLIRRHVSSIVVRAISVRRVVQILLLFGSGGNSDNGSKGERSHF